MTTELDPAHLSGRTADTDWGKARPDVIPRPTFFPAALAFGITFLLWGLVTSPVVLGMGSLLIVVSLVGWIGEMRHER
jgi:hypothetical protein